MMEYVNKGEASVPALGLGTYNLRGSEATHITRESLAMGYRHLDTAQFYENEAEIGKGIQESSVDRSSIWLTTKVWWDRLDEQQFLPSVEESLRKLGQAYVDLLLIHWPNPDVPLAETLAQLMLAQEKGYTRYIGVSNFTTQMVKACIDMGAPILTNQVEYHPFLTQALLLETLRQHGVSLTAYRPIAKGMVASEPLIQSIATDHHKTPAQIALRWLIQHGDVMAIPKTRTLSRLQENMDVFDFVLTETEMNSISRLGTPKGRMISPSFAPAWD